MASDIDSDLFAGLLAHFSGGEPLGALDPEVVEDLKENLKRSKLFGDDMARLWKMLDTVIARSGAKPGGERKTFDLLNLACGYCEEGATLTAFFGRGQRNVRGHFMDLRGKEIDKANRRYRATEELFTQSGIPQIRSGSKDSEVTFFADDATRLVGYGQIPDQFDVIFIRHQNLWNGREVWQKIYEFALARVRDDGLLIITSYFDQEHLLALQLLKVLGGFVLVSEHNPQSRELDYPGKSIDRHVAVISRVPRNLSLFGVS